MTVSADGLIRDIRVSGHSAALAARDIAPLLVELHSAAHDRAVEMVRGALRGLAPSSEHDADGVTNPDLTVAESDKHAEMAPVRQKDVPQRVIDADDEYYRERRSKGWLVG